jgi:transposase
VPKPRKSAEGSGPTPQTRLPHVPERFELDVAGRVCPSCCGGLFEMKGQLETSEMIDVVEVSYRVVQVEQQKYVCKCGGCVETAPGPGRAHQVAGTRLRSRSRSSSTSTSITFLSSDKRGSWIATA